MLRSIFLLACIIFCTSIYGQRDGISTKKLRDFETLKANYQQLRICYYGVDEEGNTIGWEKMEDIKASAFRSIQDLDAGVRDDFPIFLNLVDHIRYALQPHPMPGHACKELAKAFQELEKIRAKGFTFTRGKFTDYKKFFDISESSIEEFYNSEYCQAYQITREANCELLFSKYELSLIQKAKKKNNVEKKKATPPLIQSKKPTVEKKEAVSEPPVHQIPAQQYTGADGGKFEIDGRGALYTTPEKKRYWAPETLKLLHKLAQLNALKTPHLEIKELMPGDLRRIPGVNGTQYEVIFRNEENKKTFYFEKGWYIIPDLSMDKKHNNRWDHYSKAIYDFKILVLSVLEDFGNGSFQIFIQGSADSIPLHGRTLAPGFNTDVFQNIDLLAWDSTEQRLAPTTIHVGTTYDNEELPDSRAAFIQSELLKMDGFSPFEDRLHIFKGRVKPFEDQSERNCSVVLVVDWENAKENTSSPPPNPNPAKE